jgi:hypothetical protein
VTVSLKPYTLEDLDRTKPSVMLLDWVGEDEVTVPWAAISRERALPPEYPEDDDEPRRFSGIGPRPGSIALGIVLGASVAIGALALFLPQPAPASPMPPMPTAQPLPVPNPGTIAEPESEPESALASAPVEKREMQQAKHAHRAR